MKKTAILITHAAILTGLLIFPSLAQAEEYVIPLGDFGGRPMVAVTIDGKGPYNMILDTGAPEVILSMPGRIPVMSGCPFRCHFENFLNVFRVGSNIPPVCIFHALMSIACRYSRIAFSICFSVGKEFVDLFFDPIESRYNVFFFPDRRKR